MIVLKILLWVGLLLFMVLACWIFYIAGMSKGFQNFINKDKKDYDAVEIQLWKQLTGKTIENVDPVADVLISKKIQDYEDELKIAKRKKAQQKVLKKTNKKKKKNVK